MPPIRPIDDGDAATPAFIQALARLMAPIARLCLDRGLDFGTAQEVLKRAYVDAARAAHDGRHGVRDISRVSAATGLTRREVTRLSERDAPSPVMRGSPALQVFAQWMASRRLRDRQGNPRPLKRSGPSPSFEALAQSVTRDVHPRSLLDELRRLGLAHHDEASRTVVPRPDASAWQEGQARALESLGLNVGDHLAAALANLGAGEPAHLEQAVDAEALSSESLGELQDLVGRRWQALADELAARLEALALADHRAGREAHHRVRIGMYSYNADQALPAEGAPDAER
ncbi:DUF6502 family protein [Pelomonas aquatica]|jgi:hypothetical protein|uniref:Uncharacterized protein n=1 Tax=Pelomonas aquatica TaxID=431058 RepID=A0A9X4R787_9BURK|nr:DUF6502 family protein [Pelomonas aquatica]MCY4754481.1 DUF6502 family protein [Pelomonas aquatica]MDG0865154.1 hypothetical protein [Pelomonas aquatica]